MDGAFGTKVNGRGTIAGGKAGTSTDAELDLRSQYRNEIKFKPCAV
jgi:hypothetical protein